MQLSRDPDAEGPQGMSATKLRQTVIDDNFEAFTQGITKPAQNKAHRRRTIFSMVFLGFSLEFSQGKDFQKYASNSPYLQKILPLSIFPVSTPENQRETSNTLSFFIF